MGQIKRSIGIGANLIVAAVFAVIGGESRAPAADSFSCSPGKPNAAKGSCDCPAGYTASAIGGVAKCIPPAPTISKIVPKAVCPGGMAYIGPGSFNFGDAAVAGTKATVGAYCLDINEVTADQYKSCVTSGACTAAIKDDFCTYDAIGMGNHPINCVDWNQSLTYCALQGKRLPTEAEWEWAARGQAKGTTFPWGDTMPDGTMMNGCGAVCVAMVKVRKGWDWVSTYPGADPWPETAPVGSFPAGNTASGVHDLAGNVWEWTSSMYNSTTEHVGKGGSWSIDKPMFATAFYRHHQLATYVNSDFGFRCAKTP